MPSIKEIRENRVNKLGNIRQAGVEPYPAKSERTQTCRQAAERFEKISSAEEKIFLVGRLMTIREHGGSTFCHLQDGSGRFQAYFKKDQLGEKEYQFFLDNFDSGDFIEIGGTLFLTKKGEKTLLVGGYRLLTKSLLPLPEKWHGLKDVEERFRKRYLDLLINPSVKEIFEKRSEIVGKIREFLRQNDFMEVEIPKGPDS